MSKESTNPKSCISSPQHIVSILIVMLAHLLSVDERSRVVFDAGAQCPVFARDFPDVVSALEPYEFTDAKVTPFLITSSHQSETDAFIVVFSDEPIPAAVAF